MLVSFLLLLEALCWSVSCCCWKPYVGQFPAVDGSPYVGQFPAVVGSLMLVSFLLLMIRSHLLLQFRFLIVSQPTGEQFW